MENKSKSNFSLFAGKYVNKETQGSESTNPRQLLGRQRGRWRWHPLALPSTSLHRSCQQWRVHRLLRKVVRPSCHLHKNKLQLLWLEKWLDTRKSSIEWSMLTNLQRFDISFREETRFTVTNNCTIPPITSSLRRIGKKNKVLSESYTDV